LPELVKALGHESDWEPIPRSWWPERSRLAKPDVETGRIGRIGELPWIGITGLNAPAIARAAARILEHRGDPAAIAALDCNSGRLVLTVAFESRPCLELLPSVIDGPALAVLERVKRVPRDGKLATAAHLAAALAGLGLGARFFAAFRGQLERLADSIGTRHRVEDRRTLALLQLNRLLFLYFVQSRGWLDSRPDYLGVEVDRCLARRGRLHEQLLKPLFFGTLNRRPEERSALARRLGRIPFLNGGLFEPHPLERTWRGTIPNPVLRDVFDHLFERFHFTVHEGSGSAIAPDMLGRVFEGLMAPEDRGLSGSFYTPPRLVRTIFDHALLALMRGRLELDEEEARRRLESPDPATARLLHEITILDPAAGSGAFLLGALERLAELRELSGGRGQGVRREILQRNLFGVDINPTAVRLTELRLWLAVVAADRADSPRSVQPLPNLDCLVRQGDTLADPLNLVARLPFRPGATGSVLARLRRRLVLATGDDKPAAARAVRECELLALRECLEVADRSIERGIRECMASARGTDLFGNRRGLDRTACDELRGWRRSRSRIRSVRRRLERDGELPWFQYESHFADVFARGGFDAVIGNPPWVRAEQIPAATRAQLGDRYRWWRRPPGKRSGFHHQPDLAVAFLERATELTAAGGVVGMLLPAKLATAGYGASMRAALARDFTLDRVCELAEPECAGFQATVYPMALTARKAVAEPDHQVMVEYPGGQSRVPQAQLRHPGPWILRAPEAAQIAHDLARRFPPIAQRFSIHLGVKTGANRIFLDPPESIEPELIRTALRGRDVRPFAATGTLRLLWPCDQAGRPLRTLPPHARTYLASFERLLRTRTDLNDAPYWSLFRTGPAAAAHRVTWPDLAHRLSAAALGGNTGQGLIPLNTCYLIPVDHDAIAHRLAGWLNCTWIRALARLGADPARGGYARFNARVVGALPLPEGVVLDAELSRLGRRAAESSWSLEDIEELAATHHQLSTAARRALAPLVAGRRADPGR
jgi:hypothetical protein